MTSIQDLPAHKPIAEAEGTLTIAQAAELERKRDVVELEQTRSNAEWLDAQIAETARAESRPEPKLNQVVEHDIKTEAARHEHKISSLATRRAEKALAAAQSAHGPAYLAQVEKLAADLDSRWAQAVKGLTVLHAERRDAVSTAKALGSDRLGIGGFDVDARKQLGVELPTGANPIGVLATVDALAGLSSVGTAAAEWKAPHLGMSDAKLDSLKDRLQAFDANAGSDEIKREKAKEADEHRLLRELGKDEDAGLAELARDVANS